MRVTASALCLLATLSSFPKGISAKKETCESFSGANAASDALTWCSSPDRTTKCCTDSTGAVSSNACGNWGSNAEYTLCEGSCQGDDSCTDMLTNAASGSSISIKEGGCVSSDTDTIPAMPSNGACKKFAEDSNGVVTASIGKGSCSGAKSNCLSFLANASGDITVDIQDQACKGTYACLFAFQWLDQGANIKIKKKGCVGTGVCQSFAEYINGKITVSIGKKACSADDSACYRVGYNAQNLSSLTVSNGECSSTRACDRCGAYGNTSDGHFQATTQCCNAETGRVDNACLKSLKSVKSPKKSVKSPKKSVKSPKSRRVLREGKAKDIGFTH